MPSNVDPELIVDAILMSVEDKGEEGEAWLITEFERVRDVVLGGGEWVKMTSFESESSSAERDVKADWLLAILTQARKRLTEGGRTSDGAMLIPRLTDFPLN